MERTLLADRQAQLTAALSVGADLEQLELIDVDRGLAEWEQSLAAEPVPTTDARVKRLERELGVA